MRDKTRLTRPLEITKKTLCVYRYRDVKDGIIKYVGIVRSGSLYDRINAHATEDEWCRGKCWQIEYFECDTQSEVEAFEAHLIELYGTGKYYNIKKVGWGLNKYLPDIEDRWKTAITPWFEDYDTFLMVSLCRKLIREHKIDEAEKILELIEIEVLEDGKTPDRD